MTVKAMTLDRALVVADRLEDTLLQLWQTEQRLTGKTQSRYSKRAPYGLGGRPPLDALESAYRYLCKVMASIDEVSNQIELHQRQLSPSGSAEYKIRWISQEIDRMDRAATYRRNRFAENPTNPTHSIEKGN